MRPENLDLLKMIATAGLCGALLTVLLRWLIGTLVPSLQAAAALERQASFAREEKRESRFLQAIKEQRSDFTASLREQATLLESLGSVVREQGVVLRGLASQVGVLAAVVDRLDNRTPPQGSRTLPRHDPHPTPKGMTPLPEDSHDQA